MSGGQKRPRTNAEWSAGTIDLLLRRARKEFARHGYDEASIESISAAAGLTKGAVYYHFESKEGLFEAVFRDAQRDIVERIEARADAAKEPVAAVISGCEAFLDIALDDELRRVALIDAPRVLGWSKWRAIDSEFGLGSLKGGLRACKDAGLLVHAEPDVLAHLISGALNEAVFMVAESNDRARASASIARTLGKLLRAMVA